MDTLTILFQFEYTKANPYLSFMDEQWGSYCNGGGKKKAVIYLIKYIVLPLRSIAVLREQDDIYQSK